MNEFNLRKVEKTSLTDQVVDSLRQSIINGQLTPGTHLREVELSTQIGVSRGSLREALVRLESEGLVTSYPGRGSFVTQLSVTDIAEIYDLRLLLEKEAVRLTAEKASPDQLETLLQLSEEIIAAGQEDDVPTILKKNIQFHGLIWAWSDNGRLRELLRTFYNQVQLYLASSMHYQTHAQRMRTVDEHKEMVLAMMAGDKKRAMQVMETHLSEAERILKLLMTRNTEA